MTEKVPARFWQCIHDLNESGIRFVVVGGLALRLHGGNHLTEDLDISPVPEKENRDRLAAFLRARHARPLGLPAATAFTVQPEHLEIGRMRFLNLQTDIGLVDVVPLPEGIDSFEGLWERSVEMDLGGFSVRVASLEDLAAMKRAVNRPKDRLHLMEIATLLRLRNEADEEPIRKEET